MKLQSKIKIVLFAIILFCMLWASKTFAVSISVSPSKSTVSPGGSFSVTIRGSDATGRVNISVSGGTTNQSFVWIENNSQTITVKAGNSGTVIISASGELSSNSGKDKTVSASASVSIVKPSSGGSSGGYSGGSSGEYSGGYSGGSSGGYSGGYSGGSTSQPTETEKSKDSTLSALTVKEGKIDPEFKKDVKEYKLTIPYETSEINVTATPSDSKAKAEVKGNKDLKEGENTVTITVTAEDGSTSNYIIKVTRARVPLALKSLVIKYENQEGELVELPLNPGFAFNILEYSLEDLEYWVNNLSIEAVPNIDGAEIDIQGADNIQTGENNITVSLKAMEDAKNLKEGEKPKEETISYTIKVNKKEEPTLLTKISDWFKGIFSNISNWYDQNEEEVIIGALGVCNVALLGLSAYIVVDYRKYRDIIKKVKSDKKNNKIKENVSEENIIEEIHKTTNNVKEESIDDKSNTDEENNIDEDDKKDKPKGGKHF